MLISPSTTDELTMDLPSATEQIAINLVAQIIKAVEKKDKYGKIDLTQQQAEQYKVKIVPPKDEQQTDVRIAPPTELQPTEAIQTQTPQPTMQQIQETQPVQTQQPEQTAQPQQITQPELQRL